MNCKFDTTYVIEKIFSITAYILILLIITVVGFNALEMSKAPVLVILFMAVLLALIFFCGFLTGTISAEGNSVEIRYLGRTERISTDNIDSVKCEARSKRNRYGGLDFYLMLTVALKSGKERKFISYLRDIDKNLPIDIDKLDEYKAYIENQPLMKMCVYIHEEL